MPVRAHDDGACALGWGLHSRLAQKAGWKRAHLGTLPPKGRICPAAVWRKQGCVGMQAVFGHLLPHSPIPSPPPPPPCARSIMGTNVGAWSRLASVHCMWPVSLLRSGCFQMSPVTLLSKMSDWKGLWLGRAGNTGGGAALRLGVPLDDKDTESVALEKSSWD